MQEWLNFFNEISYARPEYFQLFYIWCAVAVSTMAIILYKFLCRPKRKRDARFQLFGHDRVWIVIVGIIGFMIISLTGPQINGFQVVSASGNLDIIVAYDESFSMAGNDVAPSRHDIAKRTLNDLLNSSSIHTGDRLSLFVFGNQSKWRMPLSDDIGEFRDQLTQIEHPKNRTYIDGNQLYTDIGAVLGHIPKGLSEQDNYYKTLPAGLGISWSPQQRIVLLFTDGDGHGSLDNIVKIYQRQNIVIYAIAVGTASGATIRVKVVDRIDPTKFVPMTIKTKVQTKALNKIATDGERGVYILDSANKSAASFLNAALSKHRSDLPHFVKKDDPDSFWWQILASSLILVVLMILLS